MRSSLVDELKLWQARHGEIRHLWNEVNSSASGALALVNPVLFAQTTGRPTFRHSFYDDWKGYVGVEHHCLVPFDSFAEPTKLQDGFRATPWFVLDPSMPLSFFAGLRSSWHGTRRKDEGRKITRSMPSLRHRFADPQKAMPVIFAHAREWDVWLRAPGAKHATAAATEWCA